MDELQPTGRGLTTLRHHNLRTPSSNSLRPDNMNSMLNKLRPTLKKEYGGPDFPPHMLSRPSAWIQKMLPISFDQLIKDSSNTIMSLIVSLSTLTFINMLTYCSIQTLRYYQIFNQTGFFFVVKWFFIFLIYRSFHCIRLLKLVSIVVLILVTNKLHVSCLIYCLFTVFGIFHDVICNWMWYCLI